MPLRIPDPPQHVGLLQIPIGSTTGGSRSCTVAPNIPPNLKGFPLADDLH